MKRIVFALIICLALASCHPKSEAPTAIYVNAVIWTGNPKQPTAEAMAVQGERVQAIGTRAEVEALKDANTKIVDLGGKFVTAGFTDSHTHFLSGGFQLASVDLRDANSPKEFIRRIAEFAKKQPKGRWITGGDWDHEKWDGALPDRTWIDSVTANNPVFVSRLDGHMALANSLALNTAKMSKETPDITGGTIVRRLNGEPTGILKDEAMNPVWNIMPPDSPDAEDEAFQRAQQFALSLGVTQVHDMGQWAHLEAYQRAQKSGKLKMRIYSFVPISRWKQLASYIKDNGRGDDWLHWGGVKGFVDGSLGSTTAWFYQPYLDQPNSTGLMTTDTTSLRKMVVSADSAQLQVAVHAIGDRANDYILRVFAEAAQRNGARDRRFRVEHAQHLSANLIARFHQQQVIASMQPYHAIDDGRWAWKRIRANVIRYTYAFKTIIEQKAHLAFGSDWTVAPIDPLQGLYAATTRRTLDGKNPNGWVPEEKVSIEDALRAYTEGCAYAGFKEMESGTLAAGKWADFVVLSDDLRKIDPVTLPNVKVLRTIVGGKEAYRRDA